MSDASSRSLAERSEIAFAAFTLVLALVVGYEVVHTSLKLHTLWGYTSPVPIYLIFMLAVCLAAVTAISAMVHSSVRGSGALAARRLALFVAAALMCCVMRIMLWLPLAGSGM